MGQFSKVILAIEKVYPVPQRALDCGPGLVNKVNDGPVKTNEFVNNYRSLH